MKRYASVTAVDGVGGVRVAVDVSALDDGPLRWAATLLVEAGAPLHPRWTFEAGASAEAEARVRDGDLDALLRAAPGGGLEVVVADDALGWLQVLISADMEGVCGVTSWVQVMPPEYGSGPSSTVEYERARARLTREVNGAVEGALAAGADEVIVNEAHNGMRNLVPEDLHESVRFITGSDKAFGMMQGIAEPGVGAVFFVGYHAKAGTPGAPLAHTWTGYLNDVRLNGRSTGEFGINAAIAGHFGVPVTMVTGDDKAVAQVRAWLGEGVVGVAVKEGYTTFSAIHLHPARAQACLFIPGVERAGERTVAYVAADTLAFNDTFRARMKASAVTFSP